MLSVLRINYKAVIGAIIALSLFLNIYGNGWGLPFRLNPDEHVARTLRMIKERSLALYLDEQDRIGHPTFYNIVLGFFMVIWLGILKITGADFSGIASAASVSWIKLAQDYPGFASGAYMLARGLSAAMGAISVLLTYLIGKRIFGLRAALWSAAILSLNMGFITVHHFAKNTPLVVMLTLLNLFFCVKALQEKNFFKYYFIAALVSGLAIATKLDGGINLCALFFTWLLAWQDSTQKAQFFLKGGAGLIFVLLGIFIGWPSVFYAFGAYHHKVTQNTRIFGLPFGPLEFLGRIWGDLKLLISCFNVALFAPLAAGVIHLFWRWRRYPKEFTPLKYMCLFYLLAGSLFYLFRATKFVVLAIPLLALVAGYALSLYIASLERCRPAALTARIIASVMLIYSFGYCLRADRVFASGDTRYQAASWIENNLARGSSIAIFVEPLNYFIPRILNDYRVSEYQELSPQALDADLLLHVSWEDMLFESGLRDYERRPALRDFFDKLVSEAQDKYSLAGSFIYREGLFWNPRPSYTCPAVYIFRKRER